MKYIHDPIHGQLKIDDWLIKIIDTPEFQRLRRISQLGFANLVYPGANHTRFEHSIGTMHIARLLVERMDISEDEKMEILAAAILHDIGHGPFSHCSEEIMKKYLNMTHEDVDKILKNGVIKDILKELGLKISRIVDHIKARSSCSIVSGDIDADRMDYLVRDSYYTGVAYGVFDISRLINKISFEDKTMIIEEGGLKAAESLLISRFMMYSTVYYHHVCRIARKMFEKAVSFCIEEDLLEPEKLLVMDDYDIVSFLRSQEGYPREIIDMLDKRRLFKRALYLELNKVNIEDIRSINPEKAEKEIAESAGIDEKYVIVDIPKIEELKEFKAFVRINGELKRLEEVSSLVRALKEAEKDVWRMGVYTKKELVDVVKKSALKYFNISDADI
ncbi:MAG TPA: HD domain-containing protein [Archaeoglobus profundus]|nr:HD domain-containing protein [Archaeoglobus profundus]